MENKTVLLGAIGVIAGIVGYEVYVSHGLAVALAVLLAASWILFNLRSGETLLNSAKSLFNPLHAALTAFVIGFSYHAFKGAPLQETFIWSIGLFFFGILLSMLLVKYWNIGG